MTRQEQQWAMQHDWWELNTVDGVFVKDYNEEGKQISKHFNNIHDLRVWAGY